jgi:hypothetical protein
MATNTGKLDITQPVPNQNHTETVQVQEWTIEVSSGPNKAEQRQEAEDGRAAHSNRHRPDQ